MKDLFDQLEKAGIKLELIQGNLKLSAEKGLITSELLAKIKANKEAIIAELEACSGAADAVLKREGETFFELSVFQREIWINSALYQTGVYNQVRSFLLEGDLNLEALEAAAFDLMDRYEILRTTFHLVDGERDAIQGHGPLGGNEWRKLRRYFKQKPHAVAIGKARHDLGHAIDMTSDDMSAQFLAKRKRALQIDLPVTLP